MTFRTLTIALLALAFLGSSIIGIQLLAHGANQTAESIEVAVATQALERGTTIQPEMVELKSWPQDLMLDGMLTSVSELADRVVLTSVVAGEPLLDDKLALPGVGQTIASLIPQGMRAITIPTPTVSSSVAGFVLPGNRVDVLLTLNQTGGRSSDDILTVTVAQNVEILAVNQKTQIPRENHVNLNEMQSVTLLATRQQASRLQLGQTRGSLHLILRHPDDQLVPPPYRACLSELEGAINEPGSLVVQSPPQTEIDGRSEPISTSRGEPLSTTRQQRGLAQLTTSNEQKLPPPPRFIRTMRGSQSGRIYFEPYYATPTGSQTDHTQVQAIIDPVGTHIHR